jgi:uncharacterized RDD family membrane protein YckC
LPSLPPRPPASDAPPPPPALGGPPRPPSAQYFEMYDKPTLVPARIGTRLGASILDGFLYGLFSLLFSLPSLYFFQKAFDDCYRDFDDDIRCPAGALDNQALAIGIGLIVLGALVVSILYIRAMGRSGQTWGRKAAGVRVVSADDGRPIGIGRALGRYLFARFISAPMCLLGYLWALWSPNRQTWHDKVVGSIVVRA